MIPEKQFETHQAAAEVMARAVGGEALAVEPRLMNAVGDPHIEERGNGGGENSMVSPDADPERDTRQAEAAQQRLRRVIGSNLLEALNRRQLTESHLHRITRRDKTYWRKWLTFQLNNDRLALDGGTYRPGPQWVISLVSMR